MSWEEYKKKREQNKNNVNTNISSNTNTEMSSWEKYKQKREQDKKTSTSISSSNELPRANTKSNSMSNKKQNSYSNIAQKQAILNAIENNSLQDSSMLNTRQVLQDLEAQGAKTKKLNPTLANIEYTAKKFTKNAGDAIKSMAIQQRTENAVYNELYGDALSSLENMANDARKKIGKEEMQGVPNLYYKSRDEQLNKINELYKEISTPVDKPIGVTKGGEAAGQISGTIGRMAPSIAMSFIPGAGPVLSSMTMGMSVSGEDIGKGLSEGESLQQAKLGGDLKGLASIGIEKVTGGVKIGGAGKLDDLVGNVIAKKTSNKVTNFLATKGYQIVGEVAEENIENIAGYAIDKFIDNKDISVFKEAWKDAGETSKMTFLTTLVLNCLGVGGSNQSVYTEVENITGKKLTAKQTQAIDKVIAETQNEINKTEAINNETLPVQDERNTYAIKEQIKQDSENFAKQVDSVKNGTFPRNDMLVLGNTPKVLKDIGLSDLPITMTQKHLDTIMNETGKYKGANYHNLGEDIVKQLPEAINNPLDVVKSNTQDNSIVLTTYLADKQNRPIIASIKIDGKGTVNDIRIDTNVMTSAYGRNNYDKFMKDNIQKGNLLYDIDQGVIKKVTGERLQLPIRSNFISNDTKTRFQLPRISTTTNTINNSITPLNKNVNYNNKYAQQSQNDTSNNPNVLSTAKNNVAERAKKTMTPAEIANLRAENANTTPKLEQRNYAKGNKQSSFVSNIITDAKFLNEDLRQEMSKEENIKYYQGITNEKTLEKAYTDLKNGGAKETLNWFNKDNKNTSAEDVAKGWILLKQYQDSGDYQSAVEVAKKMRTMATSAGQAVQAYNILSRLTPEGMFYYAQSELNEAYNKMVEGKSKKWIDENASKFDLTPEETQIIMDTMKEVSTMEDGRAKTVKLAEIQKLVSDKIPPTAGQSIKAWMRISMLFNFKTQVRNIVGNAVIVPVNAGSDIFASAMDRLIAKKTGVRTTGTTKIKNYSKGFKKGLYESYDDFRRGINTRNIEGNRFEVKEGKNFKNEGIGKALNRVDNTLSFALDGGDRGFYEATFTNSINNQLVLNNKTEATQDMIDIATTEALQRTWQDNNAYTQTVLTIRNALNGKIGKHKGMGYGLGDVLIPFAKTPANLTKAIVDYSPIGLVKTLALDARKFTNSLKNGQYSPQLQHRFVQNLGKGMAGSVLYVVAYGLASAGIATGESDKDKDVKNFMKNSLGIGSYSIKIGDKSFSYDWAQPIATPLAIMTNYVKYSKDNPDANALEKGINAFNIGSEQLLEQSFMESLNTVLNGSGTTLENLSQAVLELPARAVPTFSKQIANMVDGTQRTTFEYGKPVKSSINSVIAGIPVLSKTLPASVDTLGNEIQKYGGKNHILNVMLNPANTNKGQLSKAGEEIYNVYMQTGDTTIFPRTAPYYIKSDGETITMTSSERNEFQKTTGKYVENAVNGLLKDKDYNKLSDEKKSEIINEIVTDSYAKAKYDILKIDTEEYEKLRNTLKTVSTTSYYSYKFKTDGMKKDSEKIDVLIDANYTNKEKTTLYETYILSPEDEKYPIIKEVFTENGLNITKYLKYKNQGFEADKTDDGTVDGKTINGSKKKKVWDYIDNMRITYTQKLILYALEYEPSTNSQKQQVINYVKTLKGVTESEKLEMLGKFKGVTIYKNGKYLY